MIGFDEGNRVCYAVGAKTYTRGGALLKEPSYLCVGNTTTTTYSCVQSAPAHGGMKVPAVRLSNDGTRGQERFAMPEEKQCTKCGEIKPLDAFAKSKDGKYGRLAQCKACKNIALKQWRADNVDHIRQYSKDYYYSKAKPHNAERYIRYREQYRANRIAYYWAHREACIAQNRAWKAAHVEHLQKLERERWLNNREYMSEKNRRWRSEHPLKRAQTQAKRRSRIRGTKYGEVDYGKIIERDGWICYLCGEFVTRETLSFDHVTPLARGGKHISSNIKVAHRSCNFKKKDRLL